MKPLKLFYIIATIIVLSTLSCSGDIASDPKQELPANSLSYGDGLESIEQGNTLTVDPTWADGISPTVTYSIDPAVAEGISFNAETGQISVGETTALGSYPYTITATGTGNWQGEVSAVFTLDVVTVKLPGFGYENTEFSFASGTAQGLEPTWEAGATAPTVEFSIEPVSEGISIDPSTGKISITATAEARAITQYTITATGTGDFAGGIERAVIAIKIYRALPNLSYADSPVSLNIGDATKTISPTWEGGVSPTATFSLSPNPQFITINTETGEISIDASAVVASATITITATGNGAWNGEKTTEITVEVNYPPLPNLRYGHFGSGALVFPENKGGSADPTWEGGVTPTATFSIAPALPTGISLNTETGVITVSSSVPITASAKYTLTATGTGNWTGTKSIEISLEVAIFSVAFSKSYNTKATFGTSSTHNPTVVPEGTVTYSIGVFKPAVEGKTPELPSIDSSTGEVSTTATTTAGRYKVSAVVTGGETYTTPFFVAIFATTKQQIDSELRGENKGIAMWGNAGDFNYIDTRAVTDMAYLFTPDFNLGGGVSVGSRPQYKTFNGDISLWDVSKVTIMKSMFEEAEAFNRYIGSWKVDKVTSMERMFYDAEAFNQNISSWNVSQVTSMSFMFTSAIRFNQNISSWKVDKVTDMGWMFNGARYFNQDISSWNVSQVINMKLMFASAVDFNQNISSWAVDNVTDMSSMFKDAFKFNQDLEAWGVHLEGRTVDFSGMFSGSRVTNLPSWLSQ